MKVAILYLRIVGKSDENSPDPSYYKSFTDRFAKSYLQFEPEIDHDLIIGICGYSSKPDNELDGIASDYRFYSGRGWDIGAFQAIAPTIDCDLLICMATPVYFWRDNWLNPIVSCASINGYGLYGPMTSFENSPHIRTSCFAMHPKLIGEYPYTVNSRERTSLFESHHQCSFTGFSLSKSIPVKMVTETGFYDVGEWRKHDNIFRRGNQSNCLVWDRHTDIYANASPEEKVRLEKLANGQ